MLDELQLTLPNCDPNSQFPIPKIPKLKESDHLYCPSIRRCHHSPPKESSILSARDCSHNALCWSCLCLLPQAGAAYTGEGEKDAQSNTQSPDALHLKASSLASSRPGPVVDLAHVQPDTVHEGVRVSPGGAKSLAVEIRQRLADRDSNNNDGNKHEPIHSSVDKKGKEVVVVENVGDGAVKHSNTSLK